jgi:long-subunit fatty acid transport protein
MKGRTGAFVLLAFLAVVDSAFGQQIVTLEFSFSNPGARSMGLAGAFVALADDATAAYANPAGLVQLVEPEVSLEGRVWSYSTPFIVGGRADGVPTGIGLDTTPGLVEGESTADYSGLSFVSFVYPLSRWSLAFYAHRMAKFDSASSTQGLFADGSTYVGTDRWSDTPGFSRLEIISFGFSAGYRVLDSLSLGFGISYLDVDLQTASAAFLPDDDSLESFFGENTFRPERMIWQAATESGGDSGGLIAGLLWRATERWRLGGFYRFGFDYKWRRELNAGPAAPADFPEFSSAEPWTLPDVFGLGVAYRSRNDRWTVSLEWDRVEYSDLLENFVVAISAEEGPFQQDPNARETIPDADELRLGAEYVFLESQPIVALRMGAWRDPDHRIRAVEGDVFMRALLPPGDDQIHFTAGLGLVFKSFQVDVGIDSSDRVDTASISGVYRF